MGKFFTVDVKPDIINGDVSNVQAANKDHVDIDASDLIFDWTEVDVPKGSCMLRSVTGIVNGEDGAIAGSRTDYVIIFAKSVNGVAPTSMGTVGAGQSGGFDLGDHHVGSMIMEGTSGTGTLGTVTFHVIYHNNDNSATGGGLPLVIDLEPISGTNVGYDKLYVCGLQAAPRHYCTGVIVDGAITSDTEDTITVDGVDATKIFSVGDTVYVHDLDTQIPGTLTKVEALKLTFSEANTTVDIANNDELLNANPIRIKLGFEN